MDTEISMQFLQDGKEIKSHPDERHHEIVVRFGESGVPVTICDLPISAQCDDMGPDSSAPGGSNVIGSYHVTPAVMVRLGRIMGNSLEMYEGLRELLALSYGAPREHLSCEELAATMRHKIETILPKLNA